MQYITLLLHKFNVIFTGFTTDGEWNKIRTQGSQRPVSIIQLMMDSKEEAKSIPVRRIEQYLTPGMCVKHNVIFLGAIIKSFKLLS